MFELPVLPYKPQDLEPHISRATLQVHHGAHHRAYVDKANKLIAGTALEHKSDLEIIREAKKRGNEELFNNAAQAWNHSFYWQCLSPSGGGDPRGEMAHLIEDSFGHFELFKEEFQKAAEGVFGTGWAWLVFAKGRLKVKTTQDADLPLSKGEQPLICCDVWEHAYYLDYKNKRPDYVKAFLDHLINWDFANTQLRAGMNDSAHAQGASHKEMRNTP